MDQYCPNCGTRLEPGASFCPSCGSRVSQDAYHQSTRYAYPGGERKDPMIALILALVLGLFGIWGIGHIYVGKIARGIVFLLIGLLSPLILLGILFGAVISIGSLGIGAFLLVAVLSVVLLVLFIYQVFDAYSLAKRHNAMLDYSGRRSW